MKDYENCPHFECEETDYDVTSGHSSYRSYCNANEKKKEIIPFLHCNRCKDKFELRDKI